MMFKKIKKLLLKRKADKLKRKVQDILKEISTGKECSYKKESNEENGFLSKTSISNAFWEVEDSEREHFLNFLYISLLVGRVHVEYCMKNEVFDNYSKTFRYYLLGYREIIIIVGSKQNEDNSVERYVAIHADGDGEKTFFNKWESNSEIILRFLFKKI